MNRHVRTALYASIMVVLGMLAGFRLKQTLPDEKKEEISTGIEKIQEAIYFVENNYVEVPKTQKMVDDAIAGMLEGLDPHSFYIPEKEMKLMEEQMQGSFQGIGIEFNLILDTIYVVAPISGGPSAIVGIQAGDRIVKIEGQDVAGIGIANSDVMKKLRGEKGTKVKVTIARRGVDKLLDFEITRDDIPIYSVDFSYMIRKDIGYMKVSRFASTTHDEFREQIQKLSGAGMKNLVLDLRGNPGGYMDMAQRIADEFLSKGRLVVYTDGRIYDSKSKYKATSYLNSFETGGLVVLLDYGSASASEIVAGAVQDWDRGLIVGVRSFGKGLVQTQKEFEDGSAMRLVISKYYTPSGRCIQKPYDKSAREYEKEIFDRFDSGEIYDEKKIEMHDSLKFKTNSGRIVYGGGGILPDVFISRDTTSDTDYLIDLINIGAFGSFSYHYADLHPEAAQQYKNAQGFLTDFNVTEAVKKEFIDYAETKKVKFDQAQWNTSRGEIEAYIKAFLGRRLFSDEAFYPAIHSTDNVLQKAVELMPKAIELEKSGVFNPEAKK